MCLNTMTRGKDRSSGLREAFVATHQCEKCHETFPKTLVQSSVFYNEKLLTINELRFWNGLIESSHLHPM